MIGSALVRRLLSDGLHVVIVDNLWRGRKENLSEEPTVDPGLLLEIDLSEPKSVDTVAEILADCDAAIHLADIVAGINFVFQNQYEVFRVNNAINTTFFRACDVANLPRVLYAGTACSFPKDLQRSLDSILREEQLFPAEPESAYGWSKLLGTLELRYLVEKGSMSASTLMLHNVYGPRCDIDPARSQVIPALIRRSLKMRDDDALTVWGSGNQGRAFVYVDDVVDAFVRALHAEELPEVVQIGPNACTSIKDLVFMIRDRILKRDFRIEYDLSKPEGDIGRAADYSLARETLGWEPRTDLESGLQATTSWIRTELDRTGS
jgi:nucleoside-diphosphate-sugar epimerase